MTSRASSSARPRLSTCRAGGFPVGCGRAAGRCPPERSGSSSRLGPGRGLGVPADRRVEYLLVGSEPRAACPRPSSWPRLSNTRPRTNSAGAVGAAAVPGCGAGRLAGQRPVLSAALEGGRSGPRRRDPPWIVLRRSDTPHSMPSPLASRIRLAVGFRRARGHGLAGLAAVEPPRTRRAPLHRRARKQDSQRVPLRSAPGVVRKQPASGDLGQQRRRPVPVGQVGRDTSPRGSASWEQSGETASSFSGT